jgi:hypothetical protein
VPCVGERTYEEWDTLRLGNNAAADPGSPPARIRCGGTSGRTNVVVIWGGQEVRDYFESYYGERMLDRSAGDAVDLARDWAARLGARPHEARTFANASAVVGRRDVWDYVSGARRPVGGILRFQPWIGRDLEAHVRTHLLPDLDLNGPVRRRARAEGGQAPLGRASPRAAVLD